MNSVSLGGLRIKLKSSLSLSLSFPSFVTRTDNASLWEARATRNPSSTARRADESTKRVQREQMFVFLDRSSRMLLQAWYFVFLVRLVRSTAIEMLSMALHERALHVDWLTSFLIIWKMSVVLWPMELSPTCKRRILQATISLFLTRFRHSDLFLNLK